MQPGEKIPEARADCEPRVPRDRRANARGKCRGFSVDTARWEQARGKRRLGLKSSYNQMPICKRQQQTGTQEYLETGEHMHEARAD
jgi:hypothetical protein